MCNDPNVTERKSAPLLDNRQNKGDRDRSPVGTKEIKRIANNARFAAGGQCDQSDLVRSRVCNELFPVLFKEFLKSKRTRCESF